jgi:acetyl esterase/lipase
MMAWFFKQYLNSPEEANQVILSPLRATPEELKKLPPATIVTAEIDPLRDDGREYAKKLKAAGVEVQAKDYTGVTHEFFGMGAVVDEAKDAEKFVADRLQSALK